MSAPVAAGLDGLYQALTSRRRPEDVAQQILELPENVFTAEERAILDVPARGSLKRQARSFTSMAEEFFRPVGLATQVATARELFADAPTLDEAQCDDPDAVAAFVDAVGREIHKVRGRSHYANDRLNRADRKAQGLGHSRRRYNKLFRVLKRFEERLARYRAELEKAALTRVAKAGLAGEVPREAVVASAASASFVAYYTARSNLRSKFTISGQTRAFDEVAAMLLARCEASPDTNWFAIAHVYPDRAVLERLSADEQADLLARWLDVLYRAAARLEAVWSESNIERATMIVRKGNDSSTWNAVAGAFNKARDHWVALLDAMGNRDLLDSLCPGKVLRLMAADVAAWHQRSGGGLAPDTAVWNELPLPWEVLQGRAACPRALVEETCRALDVHPVRNGWVAPRPAAPPVPFRPTPELVHGVAVASPHLAAALRKAGWFSGKAGEWPQGLDPADVVVQRDEHGFVTGVDEGE